jgi:hypothetical protein
MPSIPLVVIMLVVISIVGAIAIPFGAPQFLDRAVALELSFIMLAFLSYKGSVRLYMPASRLQSL